MMQKNIKNQEKSYFFPRENNLEWLRIIFALQVVITHTVSHFKSEIKLPEFISNFPGVPAFFFVSGFLIYSSYINSTGFAYFKNRFLRIFPGLLFVTVGGGAIIIYSKGFDSLLSNYKIYFAWFLSQITLGQAYNPELFRSVGIGVINGSLWTITAEIIFYLMNSDNVHDALCEFL
jgi:peptidoglycan/LPS O-acetylase OafA/YrhL